MMRVYVAAPYQHKARVVELHASLVQLGIEPTATWHLSELETDAGLSVEEARRAESWNRICIRSSHALLAIGRDWVGGEMFAEAARALEWKIPIAWTGRRILSTRLPGVVYSATLEDALATLVSWKAVLPPMMPVEAGQRVLWDLLMSAEGAGTEAAE